jgi:hypothetical protein
VFRDGHTADELLESEDLLAIQQVAERLAGGAGGFTGDALFLSAEG